MDPISEARLLIVDDEALLRDLMRRFLERAGFAVEACGSADEAAALFESDPQRFALLITDLSLDGVNGEELIARLRATRPELPALIASGYPHVPRMAGVGFLQKPFLPQMLTDAVRAALK